MFNREITLEEENLLLKEVLSETDITNHLFIIREHERELEPLNGRYDVIAKYREQLWFQKCFRMTGEELLNEQMRLANIIVRLEENIERSRYLIKRNSIARELLNNSMQPFKGVNLKEVKLTQQQLF